jgi:hypothetical protein
MKPYLIAIVCFCFALPSFSQPLVPRSMKPKNPIICYANTIDQHTHVDAPEVYKMWKERSSARTKSANIVVTYVGFSDAARNAFQHAVDIWASLIESNVTINVTANWQPLSAGVLGSAIWGSVHANFPGAQRVNTWYPAALAEKMANHQLNDASTPDIVANFNSNFNWYLNTSGSPSTGQYDFITVVLHELGHGLGFVDSYSVAGDVGTVGIQGTGIPIVYDQQLENQTGQNLYQQFTSGTAELKTQLTSTNVFYNSPRILAATGGERARIYAPSTFDGGSSIAHLNEATYLSGSANSLMTPQIGAVEVNHNPGPITLAMFSDMGWKFTRIDHDPLNDTENTVGPYVITATVTSDVAPVSQIKLRYKVDAGSEVEVAMTATANPNEYQATIPSSGSAATYQYYISANDNLSRTYTSPGKLIQPGSGIQQFYHSFETGPDTEQPRITHSPVTFIQDNKNEFVIDAVVSDNLAVASAIVEYRVNAVDQSPIVMETDEDGPDSLYSATLDITTLVIGDVLEYRIKATDNSAAGNVAFSPETGYHQVNVVGLLATQDFYQNDFNSVTDDFFGDGFSVTTPAGFTNGAIHSTHPYPEGTGFPNDSLNFIYQLKIPIRVNGEDGLIRFDEVVLVEPGESGSQFGDEDFFDFVVTEGSADGGLTWIPIADGYDSRGNADWLARYNSATSGNNSTGVGDAALYRPRSLNLLDEFDAGDEVVIRFRLYSDPFARGWGWAIDNLRIQVDQTPPTVLHDHYDFATEELNTLALTAKVRDASGIKALRVEYFVNEQAMQEAAFAVVPNVFEYTLNLDLNDLAAGDELSYRFIATDSADNQGPFPASGFFEVAYIDFSAAVDEYVNDFTTITDDFVGNFFTQSTPTNFTNNAIHTEHFHKNGFGLDTTTNFSYTLVKPIRISESNPFIRFDEIVLVEGHSLGAVFGTPEFSDYVVVEGSLDYGATWVPFITGYDAADQSAWQNAVQTNGEGTPSLFRTRMINMLETGDFDAGDEVVIRFRLFADKQVNAWGWTIDNLSIQGLITDAEENIQDVVTVFPNPVSNRLVVEIPKTSQPVTLMLMDLQGRTIYQRALDHSANEQQHTVDVSQHASGLYLLKVMLDGRIVTKKVLKINQ